MMDDADPLTKLVADYQHRVEERAAEFERVRNSQQYRDQLARLHKLRHDFLFAIKSCWTYATRMPEFVDRSFFMRATDDLMESAVMLSFAIENGARNPARRELRYLLELSVQSLFVDQKMPKSSFEDRLTFFDRKVNKSGVMPEVDNIDLYLLPESKDKIIADIKSAFGRASEYVHPSVNQIEERLELANADITIGFNSAETLRSINDESFEVFALVLTLYFHTVGPSTCGDLFESLFSDMPDWSFHWHRHIVSVDEQYDYKAERQDRLQQLKQSRAERLNPNGVG